MIRTREDVLLLVHAVNSGNQDAFKELEGVAKPLLVSLSHKFSNYHHKFEYDDFYSISLLALYQACGKFSQDNPSFLDFAKLFICRACWREIEYWNQAKRNIFQVHEIAFDVDENELLYEVGLISYVDSSFDQIFESDFRTKVNQIIDDCFDESKSHILKKRIFNNEKVCNIAKDTSLSYKHVHKIIERGTKKIQKEYALRNNLDTFVDM